MNRRIRLAETESTSVVEKRKKPAEEDSLELSHHPSLVIQNAEDARVYLALQQDLLDIYTPVLNKVREESATGFTASRVEQGQRIRF